MSRQALIFGLIGLQITTAVAQPSPGAVEPYSFLPSETRSDLRREIVESAWMGRVRSAAGWVLLTEVHSEGQSEHRITPNHCLSEAISKEKDKVTNVLDSFTLYHILPGNSVTQAQRFRLADCKQKLRNTRPASFEVEPASPSEFFEFESFNQRIPVLLASYSLDAQSLGRTPNEKRWGSYTTWTLTSHLQIRETDPELKVGTQVRVEVGGVEIRQVGPKKEDVRESGWWFAATCTIHQWRTIGEGDDALPFQAATGTCDRENGFGKNVQAFSVIPELGWFVPERDDLQLKIVQTSPGRWEATYPGSATPAFILFAPYASKAVFAAQ